MTTTSTCRHDIYRGHLGCNETDIESNRYQLAWEGFQFTVVTDGLNTVKELICHGDENDVLRNMYMLKPDDDLSTVVFRETGCDFDLKETKVYFV
jgi:hypothetical protein